MLSGCSAKAPKSIYANYCTVKNKIDPRAHCRILSSNPVGGAPGGGGAQNGVKGPERAGHQGRLGSKLEVVLQLMGGRGDGGWGDGSGTFLDCAWSPASVRGPYPPLADCGSVSCLRVTLTLSLSRVGGCGHSLCASSRKNLGIILAHPRGPAGQGPSSAQLLPKSGAGEGAAVENTSCIPGDKTQQVLGFASGLSAHLLCDSGWVARPL